MFTAENKSNFKRLKELGIYTNEKPLDYRKSKSSPFMDLVVERVPHHDCDLASQEGIAYSLTHYFESNGDLCKDPDMVVILFPEQESAVASTFEQSIPPIYQKVYSDEGVPNAPLMQSLNNFLSLWLDNLLTQGHCLSA
jgi:hypothetical protein